MLLPLTAPARLLLLLVSLLLLPTASTIRTYAFDTSCVKHPAYEKLRDGIEEAIHIATLSEFYLNFDPPLQFINEGFQYIFKEEADSTRVLGVMGYIGAMKEEKRFEFAGLHIYCDNTRWTEESPSKAISDTGEPVWSDYSSGMMFVTKPECTDTMTATTYVGRETPPGYEHYRPADRTTITICEYGLKALKGSLPKDIGKLKTMEDLEMYTSTLFLHELGHTSPLELKDVYPAYGWKNVLQKPSDDALDNADSYAFFGMLVYLSSKGYRLLPGSIVPFPPRNKTQRED
ncbi:hypothetical protein EJ05DRAFT_514281 [Pseudovirgaria hyperparasitica]|uniref:Uncharacterized protein n=1 Tax=Pseudovirgaria hyperparasitica TaxID=470096 RepID=A0A6A6VUN8_9PEZI|nr:uncharacterized protein EJ05DRAFT_514281 [Pseudovirgaria hyperparasitica]KAF2754282.1 hypothetical protein EJ05DRAFT_514281 [Pseudovirgaria hyperparasitica]